MMTLVDNECILRYLTAAKLIGAQQVDEFDVTVVFAGAGHQP